MFLSDSEEVVVIAEVGQNHQGSVETALQYVDIFSEAGADIIKFQMRDNKSLFTEKVYSSVYNSDSAFAETYGAHRELLELTLVEHELLKKRCNERGVKYMCTPFDELSLERLESIGADAYKVASFDCGNLPFLEKIASKNKPTVLSVGGSEIDVVRRSIEEIKSHHDSIAVLHCVSKYPCRFEEVFLGNIENLRSSFSDLTIGLSDHFNGILTGPLGFMLGARVFEKHVTLDRSLKGTDHSFALEPEGFRKFVRDIKRVPQMIRNGYAEDLGSEPVFRKLGKVLVADQDIEKGQVFTRANLSSIISRDEGTIPVRQFYQYEGQTASRAYAKGDLLFE